MIIDLLLSDRERETRPTPCRKTAATGRQVPTSIQKK